MRLFIQDGEFVMEFTEVQNQFESWELSFLFPNSSFRSMQRSRWKGRSAAGADELAAVYG